MDRQKLLLVDDIPENLQLLYQALKEDYAIHSATSGAEALRVAAVVQPDLILLDVMMPDMDGFEVCAKLKEDVALKEVPVIFLTALADNIDELRGFEAGAVDYVTKPYKPLIVKKRVATHLALKQQKDLLAQKNRELSESLAKIKVLSGLIPICAVCKKIRDDKGYWNQLETYITQHSDALFTHGFCPDCADKMMKEELLWEKEHGVE